MTGEITLRKKHFKSAAARAAQNRRLANAYHLARQQGLHVIIVVETPGKRRERT